MATSDIDSDHLQALLIAHSRRLRILEVRAATHGINTPPEVIIEIEDIREKIKNVKVQSEKIERQRFSVTSSLAVEQDTISKWTANLLAGQISKRVPFTAYDITLSLRAKYPKLDITHTTVQNAVHTMMRLIIALNMYRRVKVKYGKHQARRYEPVPH